MRARPVLTAFGLAALGSAVTGACGCAPEAKPGMPPTTRVLLLSPPSGNSPAAMARDKAHGTKRILFGERDAWIVPLGENLELDARLLPGSPEDELVVDYGLTGTTTREAEPSAQVRFALRLESARGTRVTTSLSSWKDAREQWSAGTPLRGVRGDALERLVLAAELSGASAKTGSGVSACFSLRRMRSTPAPAARPNVLIVSVDTLRADHLGCYGYARPTSPNVDRLAQRGTLFERALSAAPWTLPSYGSLFTGLLPAEHRAGIVTPREDAWGSDADPVQRDTEILSAHVRTLAEILRANGFHTAGFSSNPFLDPRRGLGRGFELWVGYESNAANGVDLALEWLAEDRDEPWFLFLHLMDAHFPYAPPQPFDARFAGLALEDIADYPPVLSRLRKQGASEAEAKRLVDLYDGAIAFADQEIGRLLAALEARGKDSNTIVLFHSDHGEEFWEHGGYEHGHTQYQELLHVPLILSFPGRLPQGQRIPTRVRTVDVMPTLLELVGLEVPAGLAGESLLHATDVDRDALAEGILQGQREIKARLHGAFKVILSGAHDAQVFDLVADPGEKRDLAAVELPLAEGARAELVARQRALRAHVRPGERLDFDQRSRELFRGLGYAGPEDDGAAATPPKLKKVDAPVPPVPK